MGRPVQRVGRCKTELGAPALMAQYKHAIVFGRPDAELPLAKLVEQNPEANLMGVQRNRSSRTATRHAC